MFELLAIASEISRALRTHSNYDDQDGDLKIDVGSNSTVARRSRFNWYLKFADGLIL